MAKIFKKIGQTVTEIIKNQIKYIQNDTKIAEHSLKCNKMLKIILDCFENSLKIWQ